MRKIAEVAGQELEWSQPAAMSRDSELRAGGELVATLRFRSMFGTFATAESRDGCWTFKRVGFWQQRVSIRVCGSEEDVAMFRNNTWSGGGRLEFPDGREIRATTNLWRSKLDFVTGAGDEPLVQLRMRGLIHRAGRVTLSPDAAALPELPLLVLVNWYLALMLSQDDGAATAAAAG
jgi:hypothetical protein